MNIKRCILFGSILIAIIFALQILGKPIILPGFSLSLNSPSKVCVSSDSSVIVDSLGSRIIFCDEDKHVVDVKNLDSINEVTNIHGVVTDDNYYYFWGVKQEDRSSNILSESIIRYNKQTSEIKVIYTFDRTERNDDFDPSIIDCQVYNNKIYICQANYNNDIYKPGKVQGNEGYIQVLEFDNTDYLTNPNVLIKNNIQAGIYASFCPQNLSLYMLDILGRFIKCDTNSKQSISFSERHIVSNFYVINPDEIVWLDGKNEVLYFNDKQILSHCDPDSGLSYTQGTIITNEIMEKGLRFVDVNTCQVETIRDVEFSPLFGCLILLEYLSILYLIFLIIYLIIKLIIKAIKDKKFKMLKRGCIIVCLIIGAISISIFYTVGFVNNYYEYIKDDITHQCNYFSNTIDKQLLENAEFNSSVLESQESIDKYIAVYEKIDFIYGNYKEKSDKNDRSAFIKIFKKTGTKMTQIYDSRNAGPLGTTLSYDDSIILEEGDDIFLYDKLGEDVLYSVKPIKDSNENIIGLFVYGRDASLAETKIFDVCVQMTLTLIIAFIVVYLIVTELGCLFKSVKQRRRMIAKKINNPEISFTRTFSFLFGMIRSFDEVILVLIAKDMLDASNFPAEYYFVLLAAPAFAAGLGRIVGSVFYNYISSRIPVRKLAIIMSVLVSVSYGFIALSVYANIFICFCIMRFFAEIFGDVIYLIIYSMPLKTNDEGRRFESNQNREMGYVSSKVAGTLLGGVIAQGLGNVFLYFVIMLATIPFIVVSIIVLPKNEIYNKVIKKSNFSKDINKYVKFVFSVPILAYIIGPLMLNVLISGYLNFMFPQIATSFDLSKTFVANAYVVARVLTLVVNEPITKLLKNFDHWKNVIMLLLVAGFVFVCFSINSSIYWALIAVFIISIDEKNIGQIRPMLWPREAQKNNLNLVSTSNLISFIEQAMYCCREMAIAAFLVLGFANACTVIGIIVFIVTGIFYLLTRNSTMSN